MIPKWLQLAMLWKYFVFPQRGKLKSYLKGVDKSITWVPETSRFRVLALNNLVVVDKLV